MSTHAETIHIIADGLYSPGNSDPHIFAREALDRARKMVEAADAFDTIERELNRLGFNERRDTSDYPDDPPAPGEYEVRYIPGRWIDNRHNPERDTWHFRVYVASAVEGAQRVRIADAAILDGYDGPSNAWEDAYTRVGSFTLVTI